MTTYAVEVVYRGIFQKSLSRNICRSIVLACRLEGKIGTAFGRYGDSPERNGIPAKYFAVVADDAIELEEYLAQYEPTEVDVSIVVDDTLCKGVESWAWYGLQPINALTKPGGTVLVTSYQDPEQLKEDIHVKDQPYNLAMIKGSKSFSGLWVYKDDHTDVRVLGALARVCPDMVSLESYQKPFFNSRAAKPRWSPPNALMSGYTLHPLSRAKAMTRYLTASRCRAGRRWKKRWSFLPSPRVAASAAAKAASSPFAARCSRSSPPAPCVL